MVFYSIFVKYAVLYIVDGDISRQPITEKDRLERLSIEIARMWGTALNGMRMCANQLFDLR